MLKTKLTRLIQFLWPKGYYRQQYYHYDHFHDADDELHEHDHDHDDDYSNDFDIYPAEFLARMERAPSQHRIIDVRETWELQEARIEGSISIPLQTLQQGLADLDPNEEYFMICTSGIRSSYAAAFMVSIGFERVSNIQGGLNGIIELTGSGQKPPAWLLMA